MAGLVDISTCWRGATSPALKRLCGVDDEDLADMVAEIRRLDPKPGLRFGGATDPARRARRLCPPGRRRRLARGAEQRRAAARARSTSPISPRSSRSAKSEPDKTYVTDCLQTANWLTRSLEQRAKTILKVATEIVRQQDSLPHPRASSICAR